MQQNNFDLPNRSHCHRCRSSPARQFFLYAKIEFNNINKFFFVSQKSQSSSGFEPVHTRSTSKHKSTI